MSTTNPSVTSPLQAHIRQTLAARGGWIGFDEFFALALYTPELGYYSRAQLPFGVLPADRTGGGDFVTAPELSPLFGQTLATQVEQALQATQTQEVWEFGAGSGALAAQILQTLDASLAGRVRYHIVEISGHLRARQQELLQTYGARVQWHESLPAALHGVVLGNEVLDAMPVKLLARSGGQWRERGVAWGDGCFVWEDRATGLRPTVEIAAAHDYVTELHLQARAFMHTVAERLHSGAVFLLDYGFPEAEYYHPQRHMGTLMCHRAHQADGNPLVDVGDKDITAHVNFTDMALAAQEAGLEVLGYTSQARFLINCGLGERLEQASLPQRVMAQKLVLEHEMGELFKVLGLTRGAYWDAIGFAQGDRTHTL